MDKNAWSYIFTAESLTRDTSPLPSTLMWRQTYLTSAPHIILFSKFGEPQTYTDWKVHVFRCMLYLQLMLYSVHRQKMDWLISFDEPQSREPSFAARTNEMLTALPLVLSATP
jgi:hypothetical protein